eukprot:TRINITY_DN729_c0_g1_i2.p1 TRINITY_DN729_c0_g1~~TRINITY_DN729_c0_g1_i2.p1  ORF type:complete len:262 (-),score=39.75 TRINITY_DN729_c0_g1_i2:222-971(-)
MQEGGEEFEKKHVHEVYDVIAPHFHKTRYKPWPLVEEFLNNLPPASLVADVGCGNGKYLHLNPLLYKWGSDRCEKLIEFCASRGHESLLSDALCLPYRDSSFDAAISIAVIHHFSSLERRRKAIQELIRITKPGGNVLITVWAKDQEKKKYSESDVFVPWHLQPQYKSKKDENEEVSGAERQEALSFKSSSRIKKPQNSKEDMTVYQRYYHMFSSEELKELVTEFPNVKINQYDYDHDNWYCSFSKIAE